MELRNFGALAIAAAMALSPLTGCTARAGVVGEAEAPPPGSVSVEPDVWVVGDANAPDEYYSGGYYWRYEEDHWYRRPPRETTWVFVEPRVVPQYIVVHEHDHHAAIVARQRVHASQVAERRAERRSDLAEQREREAERQRELAESRARIAQQRERAEQQQNQVQERRDAQERRQQEVADRLARQRGEQRREREQDADEKREREQKHEHEQKHEQRR